jgi:hypothetical protein
MAMQSAEGKAWGLSLFPKDAQTVKCVIRGGGPAPGVRVPGTCRTSVHVRRTDEATVRFTETWNIRHYPKIARCCPSPQHTWELTVSPDAPGDHVVDSRSYGDPPPQLIR